MAVDVASYNRQFLEKAKSGEPIFNNAATYGVEIKFLEKMGVPLETQQYWRVVGVYHLTGKENRGQHHAFCDVLDQDGRRLNGVRLVLKQSRAAPVYAVIDKPPNEPGTNFPMWSNMRATVAVSWPVEAPWPSEEVGILRTDHSDEAVGNTWGHHSFYVVFQQTRIPSSEEPTPTPGIAGEEPVDDAMLLSLEESIALVGQPLIIPLNSKAMFYKIAKQKNLGERLTNEYEAEYLGKNYRAQIYEKGIIYAEVGDWDNIKIIPRTN